MRFIEFLIEARNLPSSDDIRGNYYGGWMNADGTYIPVKDDDGHGEMVIDNPTWFGLPPKQRGRPVSFRWGDLHANGWVRMIWGEEINMDGVAPALKAVWGYIGKNILLSRPTQVFVAVVTPGMDSGPTEEFEMPVQRIELMKFIENL